MKRTRRRVGSGLLRMLPVMGTQEGEFSDFSKEVGHCDAMWDVFNKPLHIHATDGLPSISIKEFG